MFNLLVVASEGAAHHPNKAILPGDMNEVYWGTIAFILIFAAFLWKGLPAVKGAMASRTNRIAKEIQDAADAKSQAELSLSSVQSRIGNADEERAQILQEAKQNAASVKQQLMTKADTDVAEMKNRALADIAASKEQATTDLQDDVAKLAVGAAHEVVKENLDAAMQVELIDRYISQVGAI